MNNCYTSIEQSRRLMALGLDPDTASFFWHQRSDGDRKLEPFVVAERLRHSQLGGTLPCWTLTDLEDLMPKRLSDTWAWRKRHAAGDYIFEYVYNGKTHEDLIAHAPGNIDAAVEMIALLIKNGYLNGK